MDEVSTSGHGDRGVPGAAGRPRLDAIAGRAALVGRVALVVVGFLAAAVLWSGARGVLREAGLAPVPRELLAGAGYVVAGLGLVWGLRRWVDRRPWAGVGLTPLGTRAAGQLLGGVLLGLVMLGTVVAIGVASGRFVVGPGQPTVDGAPGVAGALAGYLAAMAAVGFVEELVFRGHLLAIIGERARIATATLVIGLVFGVLHLGSVPDAASGALLLVSAVAATGFLVALRLVTGSLWAAIGWHAAWNWLQGAVGLAHVDRPLLRVEGIGPVWLTGPAGMVEAGVLVLAVTAGGWAALLAWGRRTGRSVELGSRLGADGVPVPSRSS